MPKHGVSSVPYFPVSGLNTGKYGQVKTPHLDSFHAVTHRLDLAYVAFPFWIIPLVCTQIFLKEYRFLPFDEMLDFRKILGTYKMNGSFWM